MYDVSQMKIKEVLSNNTHRRAPYLILGQVWNQVDHYAAAVARLSTFCCHGNKDGFCCLFVL